MGAAGLSCCEENRLVMKIIFWQLFPGMPGQVGAVFSWLISPCAAAGLGCPWQQILKGNHPQANPAALFDLEYRNFSKFPSLFPSVHHFLCATKAQKLCLDLHMGY